MKEHTIQLMKKSVRLDGRKLEQSRDVSVEYGISPNSADGSARVKIGDTEVIAGVKLDLGTPYPDKPNEGSIMVNVELLPASSPKFETGPPAIDAIELSRVTDRGIRECHAIDFKKLCIVEGEKVWMVFIDIYPINADGNLFDACALAALAALKDAKFPKYDEEKGVVNYEEKTETPVPLDRQPIGATIFRVGGQYIVDPTQQEEDAADARLSVTFTEKGTICSMQKGLEGPFKPEDLNKIFEIAKTHTEYMRTKL